MLLLMIAYAVINDNLCFAVCHLTTVSQETLRLIDSNVSFAVSQRNQRPHLPFWKTLQNYTQIFFLPTFPLALSRKKRG